MKVLARSDSPDRPRPGDRIRINGDSGMVIGPSWSGLCLSVDFYGRTVVIPGHVEVEIVERCTFPIGSLWGFE